MTEQPSHVRLDSASVKILAHPLRSRLVGALRNGGPATATALAGVLGTNSGATSYHLRKLEEVGLVVDTGEGDGKRRVWAASADFTVFDPSDFEGDDDAEAAFGWLERDWLQPLRAALGGPLTRVTLIAPTIYGKLQWTVGRGERWKFWKNGQPVTALARQLAEAA